MKYTLQDTFCIEKSNKSRLFEMRKEVSTGLKNMQVYSPLSDA